MSDPLLAYRSEFPILERTTYLVSNSLGAMPRTVPERLAEYARAWAEDGVRAWGRGWWEMPATVGDEIAPLIGAGRGEVVMVPNVTIGQAAILSAFEYTPPRDAIVMTALDFPSVRYVYERLATRLGARLVIVPSDDGITIDTERLLNAIDDRTRLVAITHVIFRSAYVMEVDAICRRAHDVGAMVSLDAFHAVGVLPVDVKRIGADFLTGGVLKWLCGGPGGAFLYASPEATRRLTPALTGWQAHARPFAFEPEHEYAEGIARFLTGTPNVPALYAATAGYDVVDQAHRPLELLIARIEVWRDPDAGAGAEVDQHVVRQEDLRDLVCVRDVDRHRAAASLRIAGHVDPVTAGVRQRDEA